MCVCVCTHTGCRDNMGKHCAIGRSRISPPAFVSAPHCECVHVRARVCVRWLIQCFLADCKRRNRAYDTILCQYINFVPYHSNEKNENTMKVNREIVMWEHHSSAGSRNNHNRIYLQKYPIWLCHSTNRGNYISFFLFVGGTLISCKKKLRWDVRQYWFGIKESILSP